MLLFFGRLMYPVHPLFIYTTVERTRCHVIKHTFKNGLLEQLGAIWLTLHNYQHAEAPSISL